MADSRIDGNLVVNGNVSVTGQISGAIPRSTISQETLVPYEIPLTAFRVWDAFGTALGAAGSDDIGITAGAFGTGTPYLVSTAASTSPTQYARVLFQLPAEYVSGGSITLRIYAGMTGGTTASVAATVDAQAYVVGSDALVSGSDLVTTSAISINSTTFANCDFTLTPTARAAGDWLDIRLTFAASAANAAYCSASRIQMLLSVRG